MVVEVVRGTTPSFIFTFSSVQVADISVAKFTIKQNGRIAITKDLSDAVVGTSTITWVLSQSETLGLNLGEAEFMINFVANGERGTSTKSLILVESNHIEEVI